MENYSNFIESWQKVATALVFVAIALGVFNYVFYKFKFLFKKTYKEKFDLANKKEIKKFLTTHIYFSIALFCLNNTLKEEIVLSNTIWFFIRVFVSMAISVLYGYVAYLILKFYYPGKLEKKLKKLRYLPRVNPENGNTMKLISEDEEDAYLEKGMLAEENIFSVDYDVWLDEATGSTKIEQYEGHLSAIKCDRCGFRTLRLNKEEIITEATDHEDGELLKEFVCSYCNRIQRKNILLSRKIKEKRMHSELINDFPTHDHEIAVVKIEIHGAKGEVKEYDFQNLGNAKKFLNEFDLERLENK